MTAHRVTRPAPAARVPPLHNGDRLTVEEFERRYKAMPQVAKAELIEGVVYMPSPVSYDDHAEQHFDLITWLGTYRVGTPGVSGGDNATLRLLEGVNRPQPDACLRILPEYGGQSRTVGGYVRGAPELTAEISASSASFDLHDKLQVYQRNGVQEYLVWRVEENSIDWLVLHNGRYRPLPARADVVKSKAFPGLWLDVVAMLQRDLAKVRAVLEQGLASNAHRRFAARLVHHKAQGG